MPDKSAKPETPMSKIHGLIHDASFAISQGETEKAQAILAEADQFTHDHC